MWAVFAFGSAVFAALTSVLAKIGINGVQSNLATAVRTVVVLVMAWGMVFLTDGQDGIASVSRKSWLFLVLSGLAKVVSIDKLSVVITVVLAAVFLHEPLTAKSVAGAVLITAGALLMVL